MFKRLGRKVVSLLLLFCRMRFKTPRILAKSTDFFIRFFYPPHLEIEYKESRTRLNSWRQLHSKNSNMPINGSVEIIVVSTSKDFEILKYAVEYAIKACVNFSALSAKIVVPRKDVEVCQSLIDRTGIPVQVINEEDVLNDAIRERIRNFNPNRYGWCLQQFLKIEACLSSKSDYCLLLDSDTILLHPRQWVNIHGKTILMPSEEFHQPYFDFITKLGVPESQNSISFVSHHLVLNRIVLEQLMKRYIGSKSTESLLNKVELLSDRNESSPFCVDFEFYAQFLYTAENSSVFPEKWANLAISRKFAKRILSRVYVTKLASIFWSSISFHSWS
jgi:hypothetical protein